jgi:hypothetical protein
VKEKFNTFRGKRGLYVMNISDVFSLCNASVGLEVFEEMLKG